MARVAMLAHVKETTAVEPPTRTATRIPWTGGKIVSNKDEALRKFYERKLRRGVETLTTEQRRVLEASIAKLSDVSPTHTREAPVAKPSHHHKSKHDVVHKINHSTKRKIHHSNGKVTSHHHSTKTIVVNGRVVGPRIVKATIKVKNITTAKSIKTSSIEDHSSIALQDKLGMSLDALVKRNK